MYIELQQGDYEFSADRWLYANQVNVHTAWGADHTCDSGSLCRNNGINCSRHSAHNEVMTSWPTSQRRHHRHKGSGLFTTVWWASRYWTSLPLLKFPLPRPYAVKISIAGDCSLSSALGLNVKLNSNDSLVSMATVSHVTTWRHQWTRYAEPIQYCRYRSSDWSHTVCVTKRGSAYLVWDVASCGGYLWILWWYEKCRNAVTSSFHAGVRWFSQGFRGRK